jgi:hypothetical protein
MSNPDQGGQQNQGGQPDQKPGQQQQKPGQGGQQGDPKPGQQEQQKYTTIVRRSVSCTAVLFLRGTFTQLTFQIRPLGF